MIPCFFPLKDPIISANDLNHDLDKIYQCAPTNGKWSSTDGNLFGSTRNRNVRVSNKAFNPKPAIKRTMSRGGFGSTISAKSRFSGKTSRSSWGG